MPIELTMPRLSDTMEVGTIIKWNVKEGDEVSAGDAVADIETDKATMEMQVYDDGRIARIMVPEGETVEVGTPIAVMAEEDESVEEAAESAGQHGEKKPPKKRQNKDREKARAQDQDEQEQETDEYRRESEPAPDEKKAEPAEAGRDGDGRVKTSPLARRLADDHGIDLATIEGSGPGGRIVKRDVLRAVEAGQETAAAVAPSARREPRAAPAPAAAAEPGAALESRQIALSNMRQTIARRLVESKTTIPHYQVTVTFEMDSLLELRSTLNDQLADQGVKLSVNDFLVRACALAIHQQPEFNASWAEDHLEIHGEVNIGVAISLPRERGGGLVVGTLRNADRKSLRAISQETRHLSEKARAKGLSIEEMSDSTFTISNLGMYGVEHFTAIINPPNSAILAVGAAIQRPVVRDGELAIGSEMTATLSLDHRIIDGAMAAQFMQALGGLLENPATLLV